MILYSLIHLFHDLILINILNFSQDEQRYIYSSLLATHFITPASVSVNQEEAKEIMSSKIIRQHEREEAMKKLIESLVSITVEVQENLRSMFLPTPSRSHYIFSLNNLGILFRWVDFILFEYIWCLINYLKRSFLFRKDIWNWRRFTKINHFASCKNDNALLTRDRLLGYFQDMI